MNLLAYCDEDARDDIEDYVKSSLEKEYTEWKGLSEDEFLKRVKIREIRHAMELFEKGTHITW